MLTEEQARTKQCCGPFGCGKAEAAVIDQQSIATSVASALFVRRVCIGSECMAWRWRYATRGAPIHANEGFCGLPIRPEVL